MSPEVFFWLALALKILIAASFVVGATVAAERAGPVAGALIATLPVSAGPSYFFLAFDHDAAFFAQTAQGSLALNAATILYGATYVVLAQTRPFIVSVPAAVAAWVIAFAVFVYLARNIYVGAALNIVTFALAYSAVRRYRDVRMPKLRLYWYDFVFRGALIGTLVGVILSLNAAMGPIATGGLAAFPIVFTSIMFILHGRFGGPACAAVIANGLIGLVGFAIAMFVLHFIAVPLGVPLSLSIALAITVAWNLGVYWLRARGIAF